MIKPNYRIDKIVAVMEDGAVLADITGLGDTGVEHSREGVDIGYLDEYEQVPTNRLAFVGGKLHQGYDLVYPLGTAELPGWRLVESV